MTETERAAAIALSPGKVTYQVGSPHKRFGRNICQQTDTVSFGGKGRITESQAALLWRMVWRYRRQISDKELVKLAAAKREAGGCGNAGAVSVNLR